jgi:uncharacterized integral membrane protein
MNGLKRIIALIIALLLAAVAVSFIVQNPEPDTVRFMLWESVSLPEGAWVVIAAVVGALIGALLHWLASMPGTLRRRRLERKLGLMTEELDRLRGQNPI